MTFPVIVQNNTNSYYLHGYEYSKTEKGLCVNADSKHNNRVTLKKCSNDASQRFMFYKNRLIHNGKCLDAAGQETSEGTPVILYSCTGNDNQRWMTNGRKIYGKQSNKCLVTRSFIIRSNDIIVLSDCDFSHALQFTQGKD
ncbi:RICIN domain-containing protein [Salmonella enterica subsp. enterica serovar Braenderup]